MRFHRHIKYVTATVVMLLLSAAQGSAKSGQVVFDSLTTDSMNIVGNLRIEHLVDDDIIKGLRKGMTVVLEYRIQIWQEKSWWIKTLIHERSRRIKIDFDNWERKFRVYLKDREMRWFEESELIAYCQYLKPFNFGSVKQLTEDKTYRIVVTVTLKPMSVENIQELKHWLAGEVDEFDPDELRLNKSPWEKTGDWVLGLVVNISGFGDRVITGKSPALSIVNNHLLLTEDR